MKADKYLQILTKHIENSKIRRDIMREYQDHIEDCKEALMESGMREAEAEECVGCLRKRWLESSGRFGKAKMKPAVPALGFQFCQGWDPEN